MSPSSQDQTRPNQTLQNQSSQDLSGTTAIVTGAGRGFGRSIAVALAAAGAHVVGVGRERSGLAEVGTELGDRFSTEVGDAADPVLAGQLLDRYRPRTVVLNAGTSPLLRPLPQQTWASFSRNWEVDVQQVFHWSREALLAPLEPGSVVIAFSSGAALQGSPLSGGYAGAKATIRFIAGYAAEESARAGSGIRFTAVLPRLTPATDLGAVAVAGYARRQGVDVPTFLAGFGATSETAAIGAAIVELATDPTLDQPAYLLPPTGGVQPLR